MPAVPNSRPFSLSIRTSQNDRVDCMFPESIGQIDSLEVFSPVDAGDNMSSNPMDEEARGQFTAFTPEMADNEDGIGTVNGHKLVPGETPWDPKSAFGGSAGDAGMPSQADGFDETKYPNKYANSRDALKSAQPTQAVIENIRQGFPDLPRPDMRIAKPENNA